MRCALDFSASEAVLCVEGVFTSCRAFDRRNTGDLHDFILQELSNHALKLSDISAWFLGIGPGNFTALRIASALISGYVAGAKTPCQGFGVPTAYGLFSQLELSAGDTAAALFDARNNELVYSACKMDSNNALHLCEQGLIKREDAEALREKYPVLCALKGYASSVPQETCLFEHIDVNAFFHTHDLHALNDLIYLRPAVFTAPDCLRKDLIP